METFYTVLSLTCVVARRGDRLPSAARRTEADRGGGGGGGGGGARRIEPARVVGMGGADGVGGGGGGAGRRGFGLLVMAVVLGCNCAGFASSSRITTCAGAGG